MKKQDSELGGGAITLTKDPHRKNIVKISKGREIEILNELRNSDSYLLDELGNKGILQMIENIKNDHAIGAGVFKTKARMEIERQGLEFQISEQRKIFEKEFNTFRFEALQAIVQMDEMSSKGLSILKKFSPSEISFARIFLGKYNEMDNKKKRIVILLFSTLNTKNESEK